MHYLKNFKSFVQAKINLMRPVTLLIGKNGAGKTNAIEGVELLAQLASGTPLYEISDIGRSIRSYEVRGGLGDCTRRGTSTFTLGFGANIVFAGNNEVFHYELCVDSSREPYIKSETLLVGTRKIFEAVAEKPGALMSVQYDNFARGGNKPSAAVSSDRSVLSRYASLAVFPEKSNRRLITSARGVVQGVAKHLQAAFVFDPSSKAMRGYERINQSVLRKDGSNISSVLHNMKVGDEDSRKTLAELLLKISQLPEEPFVDFDFIETRQGDVLFGFKRADGVVIDARMLSDGTLRALAILTALESSPTGSRVVVEEIDNGIHPSRIEILLKAIWDASKRRNLNVLATTHNPATLNALDAEQLNSVVICAYDEVISSSVMLMLSEIPRAEAIFAGGRLGDVVTKEVLDRHLAPGFELEQRKKSLEWLKALR